LNVVVAMDSFKGSLSSLEAGDAVRQAIGEVFPNAEVTVFPLADGGEGTASALTYALGGQLRQVEVTGPLAHKVVAAYGVVPADGVAIIEIAQAAGLVLVPTELRNPMLTSTYGVGELILDALDHGYRRFVVGLGGSGTNDAGLGMLTALGYRFLDSADTLVGTSGKDAGKVAKVDVSGADPRLQECSFKIACDVTNPLCGAFGASAVFGPQKGATPEMVQLLDEGLRSFSAVSDRTLGCSCASAPGAGAAGGLGYAFLAFLNASINKGVDLVLETLRAEDAIRTADIVITGEGKLDAQTLMGKAPGGVAALAKKHARPVIALSGAAEKDAARCNDHGIDAYFSIQQKPIGLDDAMRPATARENLHITAKQVFLLIQAMWGSPEQREKDS